MRPGNRAGHHLADHLDDAGWHAGTRGLGAECKITYLKTATASKQAEIELLMGMGGAPIAA